METARRTLPLVLAAGCTVDGDLTTDGVVEPERDDDARTFEESVPELPTVPLPEADKVFDVDDGIGDIVSVRVEDSLDDGELVEAPPACCDISEDVRERLGRGSLGNGPAGGGELEPDGTRLVCVDGETTAIDGDLERFEGGVTDCADEDRAVLIDWTEAPPVEDAGKLAPTDDATAAFVSVRESEAARARCLGGTLSKIRPFRVDMAYQDVNLLGFDRQ